MNKNHIVIGIGEVLWDILPEGRKIGGAPTNFAYHVSQFGMQSLVISAVGDDVLGTQILTDFHAKGLRNIIATVPYPTGTVQVDVNSEGVPQYFIAENVAWDNIPFTPELAHAPYASEHWRNEVQRRAPLYIASLMQCRMTARH